VSLVVTDKVNSSLATMVCKSPRTRSQSKSTNVVREGVCVLLLQDLLQSCARGGRRRVEDMCYERRRAEACVDESAHHARKVSLKCAEVVDLD
jgi:hypothetical protein